MKTFTINNKVITAKEFDLNMVCDLEEAGVSLDDKKMKFSFIRAYLAMCANITTEKAGKELEEHVKNGGSLEDIANVIGEMIEESGFFRALSKDEEQEVAEPEKQKK